MALEKTTNIVRDISGAQEAEILYKQLVEQLKGMPHDKPQEVVAQNIVGASIALDNGDNGDSGDEA